MEIAKTVKPEVPTHISTAVAPRKKDPSLVTSATVLFVSSMACWCVILFLANLI